MVVMMIKMISPITNTNIIHFISVLFSYEGLICSKYATTTTIAKFNILKQFRSISLSF